MSVNLGKLSVNFRVDPAGMLETIARADPRIVIHFGAPVDIGCERGSLGHRGVAIHGDVDIVPAGIASQWTLGNRDSALVVALSQGLLQEAANAMAVGPSEAMLLNRFKVRDAKLEHLAWALKAEMDDGFRAGRLYTDSLAMAMACQLLKGHSVASPMREAVQTGAMAPFRLRKVFGFIEDNLNSELSLSAIAAASGLSVSHCQRAFYRATGISVHQFVIRRRVERAKAMLANPGLSLSGVAHEVGFAHQSHMAFHMRRLLGISPAQIRNGSPSRDESNLL